MPAAPPTTRPPTAPRAGALAAVALGLTLLWVFWPTLLPMAQRGGTGPRYSHGYLVPLFSAYLLWARRGLLAAPAAPSAWGLPVLAAGLLMRFAGTYLYIDWFPAAALLPCLAGLALAV